MKPTIGKTHDGEPLTIDVMKMIESRVLVTAGSDGGKSYLLRKILEVVSLQIQTIVLDVEGEFATLRERRNMVLGGPNGEVATDIRSASLLCRKLMELNLSAVLDISEMRPTDRRVFVARFCNTMVDLPRSLWRPCVVCIDETHEYAPEDAKSASTEAVSLLASKGRKRGYCLLSATQRLAKLSKDVAAESRNQFVGMMNLDIDLKRAADILGFGRDRWQEIRDLEHEFFCFGPAINVKTPTKMKAGTVETTHPKAGHGRLSKPPAPSEKIKAVLSELSDLTAKAEEEIKSIDEAKAEIAKLKRELLAKVGSAATEGLLKTAAAESARREAEFTKEIQRLTKANRFLFDKIQAATLALQRGDASNGDKHPLFALPPARQFVDLKTPAPAPVTVFRKEKPIEVGELKIQGNQQRILNTIRWYESIGIMEPTNIQIGAIAHIDPTGGHWSNIVGPLSTNGLIERSSGTTKLTDAGRAVSSVPDNIGTLADYHQMLRARVSKMKNTGGKTIEILNAIIDAGGRELTSEEIGRTVGIDHTGGHFSNVIGPLGTIGLISRSSGVVKPTDLLFPKNVF